MGRNGKVELDHLIMKKSRFKNAAGVDISKFAKEIDLAGLKSEICELDIAKLETTLVDFSKLSNLVKNKVVRETVYDELVKKVGC